MNFTRPSIKYTKNKLLTVIVLFVVCLLNFGKVSATETTVSNITELQAAVNSAGNGDVIILANGTYTNGTLTINRSNITVRAATPGGVYWNSDVNTSSLLTSSLANRINITGNYVTFSGFQFTSGDIGGGYIIDVSGSHTILTQLNFSGYYAQKYIRITSGSQYNEISYCNIEKKPAAAVSGCTIQINTSLNVPGYHKIKYCSFQNFYGNGGDFGNEPIRIGLSTENNNASRSIVEYCYFNNTGLGDSESVSIKSQENTIRYCTFTNQQNAMLCFRNGDNNVAYSNFFINAGGIRVKEANNIFCYNNYFYNSGTTSGSNAANAVTLLYVTPVDLRTSNLVNINFIHNTFVNSGNIDLGGTGATNNTWANNIFKKSSGNLFINANNETTFAGNIYQGNLGISITSGMNNTNPNLTINNDGYYGISAGSPAINSASSSYPSILNLINIDDDPNITYDISGQLRDANKDVGCDEYAIGNTTNHPLGLAEVGPSYYTEEPTATSSQTICSPATVNNLTATGTNIKWYQNLSDSTSLNYDDSITTGTYYVSQTINGNESARKAVSITVITTALPTITSTQTFVGSATVANLVANGTSLKWYAVQTGGTALSTGVSLANGATYYVSQTLNNCESARTAVSIIIETPTQTINFPILPLKYTNSTDFSPGATSSNTSAIITYSSSNTAVATITNDNKIHIVARGTSNITASSSGAAPVTQQLIVQCSCVQN
jgi:hypothetical protein